MNDRSEASSKHLAAKLGEGERELGGWTLGSKACLGREMEHARWSPNSKAGWKGKEVSQVRGGGNLVRWKPPCRWLLKVVFKRVPIAQLYDQLGNIFWQILKGLKILHTGWPKWLSKGSYRCLKFSQNCWSKCHRSNMSHQSGHLTNIWWSNVTCWSKWLSVMVASVNRHHTIEIGLEQAPFVFCFYFLFPHLNM